MAMFSGLLDGMTFTVKSPDQHVTCELADGRDMTMDVAAGRYRRYTERELERQLSGLLTSFWSAHRQAHLMMLSELAGYTVRGGSQGGDRRARDFVEERGAVRVDGKSASGRIALTATGMRNWSVRIKPDTVRTVDEETFLYDFWTAFTAATNDYHRKVAELKREITRHGFS
ncbi:MAG: YbaB/EbfC family nucleoid-associated protein [Micromonosporaceae bacterium]